MAKGTGTRTRRTPEERLQKALADLACAQISQAAAAIRAGNTASAAVTLERVAADLRGMGDAES